MPDQNPTLDYGRPEPLQRSRTISRIINRAISVVLVIVGLAAVALAVMWCCAILYLRVAHDAADYVHFSIDIALAVACGSLLLWLAWKNLKRR